VVRGLTDEQWEVIEPLLPASGEGSSAGGWPAGDQRDVVQGRRLGRRERWRATIAERRDHQANRRRRGQAAGRPPAFDRVAYRCRNIVERCFNRLK
jgi:transposase